MFTGSKSNLVRILFQGWALFTMRTQVESLSTELARLQSLTHRKKSIWTMSKAELVQEAREVLDMSLNQAQSKTVTVLRELLRARKEIITIKEDPLAEKPKGLSTFTLQQLKEEADRRSLPPLDKPTKGKLLVMIEDDVMVRNTLTASTSTSRQTAKSEVSAKQEVKDEDDEMEDRPKKNRL